jgi:hypothetical protein
MAGEADFFWGKRDMEAGMVDVTPASNSNATDREVAEDLIVALKNTTIRGKPFLVEWRQPDANDSCWQGDSGAGCGCGPVE